MGEWYRDLFSLKWAIVWPLKKKEPYGDFGGSCFHPDLPADLPEASFLVITLILNFTDCTLLWVTHLSLAEQEVVCNVCETQRAALSPLPFLPQWVGAALVFIQVHLHRTWQNPKRQFAIPLQVSSTLCSKLSKSRLCGQGDKGNYLQKN